jgi:hypothetical protein
MDISFDSIIAFVSSKKKQPRCEDDLADSRGKTTAHDANNDRPMLVASRSSSRSPSAVKTTS